MGHLSVATDPTFRKLVELVGELDGKLRAAYLAEVELVGELADFKQAITPCSMQLTIWRGPLGDGVADVIELLNDAVAPLGVVLGE
jgi:hypothetical protein